MTKKKRKPAPPATILVIVQGGVVQEVDTRPGQSWDIFDHDDFDDDPISYWEGMDAYTREHIKCNWPDLYAAITDKLCEAARSAKEEEAQESAKAQAIAAMN